MVSLVHIELKNTEQAQCWLNLAPSHYLNQCWVIVNWNLRYKIQWNINRNLNIFIQENALENVSKIAAVLSRPQSVDMILPTAPQELSYIIIQSL